MTEWELIQSGKTDEVETAQNEIEANGNEEDLLELGEDFSFEGFQVVRREFFAHMNEPAVSFNEWKFYVNRACFAKLADTDYIEVLVNSEKKLLLLLPSEETNREAFQWCTWKDGKRQPKKVTCKIFYALLMELMGWSPNSRYKILGKLAHANGKYLLAFDLTATEEYQRTIKDNGKPKMSRTPILPAEWKGQFGKDYIEHLQSVQIDIFDGYAVYALKDKEKEVKQGIAKEAVTE